MFITFKVRPPLLRAGLSRGILLGIFDVNLCGETGLPVSDYGVYPLAASKICSPLISSLGCSTTAFFIDY
jgi:hypothetical protein